MTSSFGRTPVGRLLVTVAAGSILMSGAVPAMAQDNVDGRLKKVEAEVRALQRKVFPGPDGKFFEPEITPGATPTPAPGLPATTPVTDLLTRMDAVEAQMARLTSQVEENSNRLNQIEAKLASEAPAATPAAAAGPIASAPAAASQTNLAAMTGGASAKPAPAAAAPATAKPTPPSSVRVDAVKAIVKPQTDDPGDDEYSYGYRLWDAKFYPEAEQQLKLFLEKYPKHARASWGRNLVGRAYLDDGNPGEAAKWFLQNYQTDKRGERAPDSLLYLAVAMKQLKDSKRACIALAEFSETYATEAAGRLKSLYDATRNGLACS
jgi:TolA-binding protein